MLIDHFDTWGNLRRPNSNEQQINDTAKDSGLLLSSITNISQQPQISISLTQEKAIKIEFVAPFLGNQPPDFPRGRLWGLWEYEVLELFIAGANEEYLELEFGPFEHHLALYFEGERMLKEDRVDLKDLSFWRTSRPLETQVATAAGQWGGRCLISQEQLPPSLKECTEGQNQDCQANRAQLHLAINAFWCFHDLQKQRHFCCAFPLPGLKPNFHQPKHFPRHTLSL